MLKALVPDEYILYLYEVSIIVFISFFALKVNLTFWSRPPF